MHPRIRIAEQAKPAARGHTCVGYSERRLKDDKYFCPYGAIKATWITFIYEAEHFRLDALVSEVCTVHHAMSCTRAHIYASQSARNIQYHICIFPVKFLNVFYKYIYI